MALVLYKCDVCKRDTTIPRNPKGLETFGRCTITLGCRGRMYQSEVLEDFVRGALPDDVVGLDNWYPRRALYNHTQQQSQTSWIITHGLGTFPVVSVFVNVPTMEGSDQLVEITPDDIVSIDDDTIKVTFSTAYTGIAQLVARSSDAQLFNPTTTPIVESESFAQITANSELTIATLETATSIRVFFTYITPSGISVPVSLVVDDVPGTKSPWVGVNRVLIQGKIFTVRSFDLVTTVLSSGLVPDGSRIIFNGIQPDVNIPIPVAPSNRQVYILLSGVPHTSSDRLFESVVDAFSVSAQSGTNNMVLSSREVVITTSTITSIHPLIRSL